ncbi:MAG: phosphoglycerate dehydrogenase [bacterium]
MKKKVLIALQTFSEYSNEPLKLIKNSGVEIVFNKLKHRLNREEIVSLGSDADGIIAGVEPYDKEVLGRLPKLKCISRCGVGIDNIDLEVASKKDIKVLNTPDAVIQPVAEMTVAMIFDLLKLLTVHTQLLKSKEWKKRPGHMLAGRKIGIVGLGRIGRRVAEILNLLGGKVYGCDPYPDIEWSKNKNITILPFNELVRQVNVISFHIKTDKNNSLFIGENEISLFNKGTVVVNTSRGQIFDETALYNALKSGHIGGAALDVFCEEPYKGPLCEIENVILTPHISTLTEGSRTEMEVQAVLNILRYFNLEVESN